LAASTAPDALEQLAFGLRVVEDVRDLLAQLPPVAQPGAALGRLVVATEQLEHARRVARAAGVLQQQRVEQIGLIGGGQTQRPADPHPD
jgi:hypothetical protein